MGDPVDFRPIRLGKKAAAGADFIQTQGVYDVKFFAESMKAARNLGLHEKTAILAGIIVPERRDAALHGHSRRRRARAGGTHQAVSPRPPEGSLERGKGRDQEEDGRDRPGDHRELIEQCRAIEGVRGVHVQAIEAEHLLPVIMKRAGLLPRPVVA